MLKKILIFGVVEERINIRRSEYEQLLSQQAELMEVKSSGRSVAGRDRTVFGYEHSTPSERKRRFMEMQQRFYGIFRFPASALRNSKI
jgi:hypothetical protein